MIQAILLGIAAIALGGCAATAQKEAAEPSRSPFADIDRECDSNIHVYRERADGSQPCRCGTDYYEDCPSRVLSLWEDAIAGRSIWSIPRQPSVPDITPPPQPHF